VTTAHPGSTKLYIQLWTVVCRVVVGFAVATDVPVAKLQVMNIKHLEHDVGGNSRVLQQLRQ
jgi:hypothetical protein